MATENKKALVFSILEFLQKSCNDNTISSDDVEGIEVAMQCIGEAFGVDTEDAQQQALYSTKPANLLSIFEVYLKTKTKSKAQSPTPEPVKPVELSEEDKKKAEDFKAAGNRKVAERNYPEAINLYTQAIEINGNQAVYYANRAAAYSQQGEHQKAVDDAKQAITIDPKYSKAYSRMGHALFCQKKYAEAVEAYENGLTLDPENPTLKSSLQTAKSKLDSTAVDRTEGSRSVPSAPEGMPDLSSMLNNPALMGMAQQMMQSGALGDMMNNPEIARMAQQMMGNGGAGGLAEMMRNPEMMNMARQFMGGNGGGNAGGNGGN
ncbi:hypothetical protein J3Q64DRAFT_1745260 [Phycomyces blakesleeanus]|uniref:SGTA homodimerisation domain-containing protein n=1 Tax=Phycomyces blakesleeanus TaxID=4837 RepID=A0ABR3AY12_PHYBL